MFLMFGIVLSLAAPSRVVFVDLTDPPPPPPQSSEKNVLMMQNATKFGYCNIYLFQSASPPAWL